MNTSSFLVELDSYLQAHPACQHPIWEELHHSGNRSAILRAFAVEYGVLRRALRPMDAACPNSHELYGEFSSSCGEAARQDGFEHVLPGTRLVIENLLNTLSHKEERYGAIWAMERVARFWAQSWCAHRKEDEFLWDDYWRQLSKADLLVPSPQAEQAVGVWYKGFRSTLEQLALFLDSLELAVRSEARV